MQLSSASSFSGRPSSDVLVLPFWQSKKAVPACPMQEFKSFYSSIDDFQGKEGETLFLYKKQGKESRILLLGLGKKDECGAETLRKAYAAALKACRKKKLKHISAALPETDGSAAYFVTEGLLLTNYAFDMKFSKE